MKDAVGMPAWKLKLRIGLPLAVLFSVMTVAVPALAQQKTGPGSPAMTA